MASNAYSAELQVEPRLRHFVIASACLLVAAGVAAIWTLPVPAMVRGAAAIAWSGWSAWPLWRLHGCWSTYVAVRVASDGTARLCLRSGEWQDAQLLPGSVLLQNLGWIRLQARGGPAFAEPVSAACQKRHDWRRLQVIWRHIGAPV